MSGICLDRTNQSARKLVSTHGKLLLTELSGGMKYASLQDCLDMVTKDPNAGRLKEEETMNNAFHLLLGSDFTEGFILPLLKLMINKCPQGLRTQNFQGNLPLHLLLTSSKISHEAFHCILSAYPDGASVVNNQGFLPLFIACMREDADIGICRPLVKAFPTACQTLNKSRSLPLHFAVKRVKPNREVVAMLLRRHPEGAKQLNSFGLLPFHCASSSTNDIECLRMVLNAYPEAIQIPDRQGRTCLHLSVLACAKDHQRALREEEEEEEGEEEFGELGQDFNALNLGESSSTSRSEASTCNQNEGRKKKNTDEGDSDDGDDEDEDDDEDENHQDHHRDALLECKGERNREALRFLVHAWPTALLKENNFQTTPVETVLEKTRQVNTKKKQVRVFGMYDDSTTARLLLLLHRKYFQLGILPSLRFRHAQSLRELNWNARKSAIFASYTYKGPPSLWLHSQSSSNSQKRPNNKKGGAASSKQKKATNNPDDVMSFLDDKVVISSHNLFAQLRHKGELDCLRHVVSFI